MLITQYCNPRRGFDVVHVLGGDDLRGTQFNAVCEMTCRCAQDVQQTAGKN